MNFLSAEDGRYRRVLIHSSEKKNEEKKFKKCYKNIFFPLCPMFEKFMYRKYAKHKIE